MPDITVAEPGARRESLADAASAAPPSIAATAAAAQAALAAQAAATAAAAAAPSPSPATPAAPAAAPTASPARRVTIAPDARRGSRASSAAAEDVLCRLAQLEDQLHKLCQTVAVKTDRDAVLFRALNSIYAVCTKVDMITIC